MDLVLNVFIIAVGVFFLKRAIFGPQRQLASLFFVCLLIGGAGVVFADKNGIVFNIAAVIFLLAPLIGTCILLTTTWHDMKRNKSETPDR